MRARASGDILRRFPRRAGAASATTFAAGAALLVAFPSNTARSSASSFSIRSVISMARRKVAADGMGWDIQKTTDGKNNWRQLLQFEVFAIAAVNLLTTIRSMPTKKAPAK